MTIAADVGSPDILDADAFHAARPGLCAVFTERACPVAQPDKQRVVQTIHHNIRNHNIAHGTAIDNLKGYTTQSCVVNHAVGKRDVFKAPVTFSPELEGVAVTCKHTIIHHHIPAFPVHRALQYDGIIETIDHAVADAHVVACINVNAIIPGTMLSN